MRTKRHYTEYIPSRVGSHIILSLCPPPAARGTAAAGSTLSLAPKRRPSQLVALDKDRVMVETAMRLDVAVAGLVGEASRLVCVVVVSYQEYSLLVLGIEEECAQEELVGSKNEKILRDFFLSCSAPLR